MSDQLDLNALTLGGIGHRCAEETKHFFHRQAHDPRFCFELFRRALLERNQHAWELIYAEYRPLVAGWVERHPAFPATGEEAQYFVNRAFEKMWLMLTADKFCHFPNLRSLLRYLQMCVHSVILDHVRAEGLRGVDIEAADTAAGEREPGPVVESQALSQVERQRFWEEINARLHNEQERRVIYGSFVLALKPQALCAQFPETFGSVDEVYLVKQNVLARLRRDVELAKFLGQNA